MVLIRAAAALLTLPVVLAHANPDSTVGFPQFPALSPDGSRVVFSWAGDLWLMRTDGFVATRLTSHPADERRSAFSPDGTRLAFESDRDGNRSIYVMDLIEVADGAVGGPIRRVTVAPSAQTLGGWTADGQRILFASNQDPSIYRSARMFSVPAEGGPVERLTPAFGTLPRAGADGSVLFNRGYWIWERPAYRGPGGLDLWRLAPDGSFERLTHHDANDGDAFARPDGSVVFVSSRDGQNNLWRLDAGRTDQDGAGPQRLTDFAPEGVATIGHGVRDLAVSANGSMAAFCVWDTLYTLDLSAGGAQPVALHPIASVDSNELDFARLELGRQADEAAMSPDGNTMAVVARGEVFVRSTKEDRPTRRVTDSAARERDLAWSPDNTRLYFAGDGSGRYAIYEATVALSRQDLTPKPADPPAKEEPAEEAPAAPASPPTEPATEPSAEPGAEPVASEPAAEPAEEPEATDEAKPADAKDEKKKDEGPKPGERWRDALRFEVRQLIADPGQDVRRPTPSPDGTKLLYLRGRGDLVLRDLKTGEERTLLSTWNEPDAAWASDGRHVVYAVEDLDFNSDIFLLDTQEESATPVNLTRHPDFDGSPRLSHDGKVLTFLSDRGGMSWEFDVYAVYLDRKLEGLTEYELDEYYEEAGKAVKKLKAIDPVVLDEPAAAEAESDAEGEAADGEAKEKADEAEEAKDEPGFAPDAGDAWQRVRRVTSVGNAGTLAMTPDGSRIAFSATIDGTAALYSVDHKGEERKTVRRGGVSGVTPTLTGDAMVYVASGQAHSSPPAGGKETTYDLDAPVVIDIAQQQHQKFTEAARTLGDGFYHPTLKGLDWDALTQRYRDLATKTRTTDAFNRVGSMLFGELNGSHLGIWGGGGFSAGSEDIGALGIRVEAAPGGYRVTHVMDGGPASRRTSELKVGDVLTKIGRTRLAPDAGAMPEVDLDAALAGAARRETLIERVPADAEASPFVLIVPEPFGAMRDLAYLEEVERRRRMVEELSGGKLGYLHIESMGMASVLDYERDLYAAAAGKLGLVIDVRDNGGGWTTDILLASLTAPAHAYTIPRGASDSEVTPLTYPRDRRLIYAYQRPISVLINENSFSNAEIFAHSIKTTGRGTLVGTQTFGGVISTGAFRLIDGTTVRMPFRGWFLPDGRDMENNGAEPDIEVAITPADEAAGRDPQLEAAVKDLLERAERFERELSRAPRAMR